MDSGFENRNQGSLHIHIVSISVSDLYELIRNFIVLQPYAVGLLTTALLKSTKL